MQITRIDTNTVRVVEAIPAHDKTIDYDMASLQERKTNLEAKIKADNIIIIANQNELKILQESLDKVNYILNNLPEGIKNGANASISSQ